MAAEPLPPPERDINLDLGFGSVVARESRRRLLNRDGTFNVRREGLRFWESLSAYHYLLTISWRRFMLFVIGCYIAINALFAVAYLLCGDHALSTFSAPPAQRFGEAFFFSVETVATIGYGNIAPMNLAANLVMTVESLVGLLGFAVVAGIMFARFSRPIAAILFSEKAIVAPYRNITAFMFRVVNQRSNQIVELNAKVILALRRKDGAAGVERDFFQLKLERDHVVFFPLTWTVVHPIDKDSPLFGLSQQELIHRDAEILILLNGFDETFSQTVHTRSSYQADEVVFGARFRPVFSAGPDRGVSVDVRKLHEIDRVPLNQG